MSSHARNSLLCLAAAGICWGFGGVTGQALADATGLPAGVIAAYRLGCGGGLLVLALLLRRAPIPRHRAVWLRILAVAGLAAVFQTCYFAAVSLGSVSVATLITIGSAPVFVAVVESAARRRRPGPEVFRRLLVGGLGLVGLVGAPATGNSTLLAAALAALSGLSFAVFTLLGRKPAAAGESTVIGYGFLVGGLAMAAVSVPFGPVAFAITTTSAILLILLATVPTALAYTLFFVGLRGAQAGVAAILALLEPLTGTLLAMAVLGERLSAGQVVGAILLLGCVLDAAFTSRQVVQDSR